jgi:hypothetical protein
MAQGNIRLFSQLPSPMPINDTPGLTGGRWNELLELESVKAYHVGAWLDQHPGSRALELLIQAAGGLPHAINRLAQPAIEAAAACTLYHCDHQRNTRSSRSGPAVVAHPTPSSLKINSFFVYEHQHPCRSVAAVHCRGNTEIWLIGWRTEPMVSPVD